MRLHVVDEVEPLFPKQWSDACGGSVQPGLSQHQLLTAGGVLELGVLISRQFAGRDSE
jgi:hypothetical protein